MGPSANRRARVASGDLGIVRETAPMSDRAADASLAAGSPDESPARDLLGSSAPRHRRPRALWRGWLQAWVGFGALFGALGVIVEVAFGKAMSGDTAGYEYYAGWAFFHGFGSSLSLPGQLQTYLDPQINSLYYLLIAHTSALVEGIAVALLESLSCSLLATCVFVVARRRGFGTTLSWGLGLVGGAAAFSSPIFLNILGSTQSDSVLVAPLVVATLLLASAVATSRPEVLWRHALLSGVVLGGTVVAKLTTFPFAVALVIGFSFSLLVGRREGVLAPSTRLVAIALAALASLLTALALYAPLGILVWQRYRNPFFPYLNEHARSPLQQPGNFQDRLHQVHGASDWLHHLGGLLIGTHALESGGALQRSPLLVLGTVLIGGFFLVDVWRRRPPVALFLESSMLVGFVVWSSTLVIYRYAAVLEMGMASVLLVLCLERARPTKALLAGCCAAIILLCALSGDVSTQGRQSFSGSFFGVDAPSLVADAGSHVIVAGNSNLGYLVTYLPSDTEVVRVGGNLTKVMSDAWWARVASALKATPDAWTVIELAGRSQVTVESLRAIGVDASVTACRAVANKVAPTEICRVTIASATGAPSS